eukprot:789114-Rhodomonas_salina.2
MLASMRERLPGWDVQLLTFVLGNQGLFDEKVWRLNMERLCLSLAQQKGFICLAQTGAHEVVDNISYVWTALLRALHA